MSATVALVVRNIIPIVGVLFLHWSPANILILYFIDTLFAFGVMIGGLLYHLFPDEQAESFAARVNAIAGYAIGALFLVAVLAIPLGMPVFIMVFGIADVSPREIVNDRGFVISVAMQAIVSLISFRDLVVALRTHTPEQLAMKQRFGMVFLRWVGTIIVAYTPLPLLLGRFGPFVVIIVYIALTIYAELKPERFLAAFGANDASDVNPASRARQSATPLRPDRVDNRRPNRKG